MEDQETLKTGAVVGDLSDPVQDEVNDFFANGVMTSGVVVGGILFATDHLIKKNGSSFSGTVYNQPPTMRRVSSHICTQNLVFEDSQPQNS